MWAVVRCVQSNGQRRLAQDLSPRLQELDLFDDRTVVGPPDQDLVEEELVGQPSDLPVTDAVNLVCANREIEHPIWGFSDVRVDGLSRVQRGMPGCEF
jgi:hypothetical protein